MTVLAADKQLEMREPGGIREFPVIGSDIIYKGALVNMDATGYAQPAADTTGLPFIGVAVEQADNSSGSSGDIVVQVYTTGSFRVVAESGAGAIAQTSVGKICYVVDDATVDDGAADNFCAVGMIEEFISATDIWVRINHNVSGVSA